MKNQHSIAQVIEAMIEAHNYAWAYACQYNINNHEIVQAIYIAQLAWLLS